MLKFTDCDVRTVYSRLDSGEDGLSEKEAERRLERFGKNLLKEEKKRTVVGLFFSQFCDLMTILLIAAAFISAIVAFVSKSVTDLADTAIICVIIALNAVVGTVQQYRADKAIEGLKKLNGSYAKVRRGGVVKKIDCTQVTVGDVVLLEEGDVVPADMRITKAYSLRCVEAALTGEAAAVEKCDGAISKPKADYHDAKNIAFSSTFVVGGRGEGVVIATGSDTEIGAIAKMLGELKKVASPLERSLNKLGKIISAFVVAVAAVVFCVGVFALDGGVLENFMTAVAIAVAAVPEGLPAVVSVITAMGVQRLSRENVVIRKMKCVETLGGCTAICTDKTGTLTCNQMKVVSVICADNNASSGHSKGCTQLYECMAACNSVKGKKGAYMGDPTEIALKMFTDELGLTPEYTLTGEIPFSSERKLMSVKVRTEGGEKVFCKGAPETVLSRCAYIQKGGEIKPLTDKDRQSFLSECENLSDRSLRVLAFACRNDGVLEEKELVLLGACGMEDGLKDGVRQAVEECERAGITTVMITGDSARTALAVAQKAGICQNEGEVFTGEQLDEMTKPQLKQAIRKGRVFARVSPKHKNVIVKVLQSCGETVAMTGDGVNDAPGLKSANIGIVMGRSGTEVAKSVADMVICDDNFTTIVAAVKEGRRISSNVKKTIQFFLSTNLAEVLSILIVTFAFMGCGFLPSTQLLWLNLITDSFPVLALGVERGGGDDMAHPPVRAEKALFSKESICFILFSAAYITGVTVAVYAFALNLYGVEAATTAAFITISFAELFHAFNVRSGAQSAFCGILSNKVLIITVLAGVAANVALCLTPLASAFKIVSIPLNLWALCCGASLSVILFCEGYKLLSHLFNGKSKLKDKSKPKGKRKLKDKRLKSLEA
ncbi:MAG: cation-translocating P-type ATPase [Candidatus Coproplasma sp.]